MPHARVALYLLGLTAGVLLLALVPAIGQDRSVSPAEDPIQAKLLEVGRTYKTFGRVDDEMRWAPTLCREPNRPMARYSASKDADTHGQKLYSLFARDPSAYLKRLAEQPVGQVIVKQSWVPEAVTDETELKKVPRLVDRPPYPVITTPGGAPSPDAFIPYARKDDRIYKATKQADLFVMLKMKPDTRDTDQGWVYATLSADGKKVTASGKIASCTACHEQTKQDRMFGLPGAR
jgi:hypothetical protein